MSPFLTPARRSDPEWMDREGNSREDLEGALRDIRRVNRWLGGASALLDALDPYLAAAAGPVEILDVGTGAADLPLAIVERGRRRGVRVRVTALDLDPVTAAIARREVEGHEDVRVVQADALQPPFDAGSFDVVTASMFLHHFEHGRAVELLRVLRRLARRAVVINDLRRHLLPWSFIWVVSRATLRHPMFAHDAPLSVLRGFTGDELLAAAREAGAEDARVIRRWPYRLLLTIPCNGAAS